MIAVEWVRQQFPEVSSLTEFPSGGQKWVFGAVHPADGDVVLKLIRPTTDEQRVSREVLAVNQVNSSRVPKIFATGVLGASPLGCELIWLREQRIAGCCLREALTKQGPLAKDDVLQLALHALEALADVERARIVHRDVKPDNIVRGDDGAFWLLDFGIARLLDLESLTATVAMGGPGTLGYAPPEQYRNKKQELDARADLFALAVTIVEAATGVHPYRHGARDASDVIRRIEGAPLAVPKMQWDRERRFSELIEAMGQRRLDCRPSSAEEALAWMRDVHNALK